MSSFAIGDLARGLQLRSDQARIQSDLLRLSNELSTGQKSKIGTAVAGDFGPLVGLDADLRRLDGYDTTVTEAALLTSAAQAGLERVQTSATDLASNLILVQNSTNPNTVDALGAEAKQAFEAMISALNQTVGDKTIFAGVATDAPALAQADVILGALSTAVSAETTAADVEAIVEAWFAPGGDFETIAYLGATDARAPIRLNDDADVVFGASANDTELREVLKSVATAALLEEGVLLGAPEERAELAGNSGQAILTAETGLIDLRSRIGRAEESIDVAKAQNQARRSALDIARSEIVTADPFTTAAELEATQFQLEALYTVTARLSQLTLTKFLR